MEAWPSTWLDTTSMARVTGSARRRYAPSANRASIRTATSSWRRMGKEPDRPLRLGLRSPAGAARAATRRRTLAHARHPHRCRRSTASSFQGRGFVGLGAGRRGRSDSPRPCRALHERGKRDDHFRLRRRLRPSHVLVLGVVTTAGGVATLLGYRAGLGVAAGVTWGFLPFLLFIARQMLQTNPLTGSPWFGPSPNIGFLLWAFAWVLGAIATLMTYTATQGDTGRARKELHFALVAGAVLWLLSVCIPPESSSGGFGSHLFVSDALINLITVKLLSTVPVALFRAALRQDLESYGVAFGVALWWYMFWITDTLNLREDAAGTFATSINGQFVLWTAATLIMAVSAALAATSRPVPSEFNEPIGAAPPTRLGWAVSGTLLVAALAAVLAYIV